MSHRRRFLAAASCAAAVGFWGMAYAATSLGSAEQPLAAHDLTFGAAVIDPQGKSTAVFGQPLSPGPKEGVMILPAHDGQTSPTRIAVIIGPAKRPKAGQDIPHIRPPKDQPQAAERTSKLHSVILPPYGESPAEPRFGVVVIRKGPPLGVGEDNLSYRLCAGPRGPVAEVHAPANKGGGLLWAADFTSPVEARSLPACDP